MGGPTNFDEVWVSLPPTLKAMELLEALPQVQANPVLRRFCHNWCLRMTFEAAAISQFDDEGRAYLGASRIAECMKVSSDSLQAELEQVSINLWEFMVACVYAIFEPPQAREAILVAAQRY